MPLLETCCRVAEPASNLRVRDALGQQETQVALDVHTLWVTGTKAAAWWVLCLVTVADATENRQGGV